MGRLVGAEGPWAGPEHGRRRRAVTGRFGSRRRVPGRMPAGAEVLLGHHPRRRGVGVVVGGDIGLGVGVVVGFAVVQPGRVRDRLTRLLRLGHRTVGRGAVATRQPDRALVLTLFVVRPLLLVVLVVVVVVVGGRGGHGSRCGL